MADALPVKNDTTSTYMRVVLGLGLLGLVIVYAVLILNHYDFVTSDTRTYIERSLYWDTTLFARYHLPLYAVLIRLLGFISVPPVITVTLLYS